MPVNSVAYLVFVAAAVALFWLLPVRLRRAFVLLASLVFYASWGLPFAWVPLLVAAIAYVCGTRVQKDGVGPRRLVWLGIVAVLVLLVVLKYRSFAVDNLNLLFSHVRLPSLPLATAVAFPLGISFYTFEAIAYLIDVRQGRVKMPGFVDLCLFFYFWPNILSGPIVRARELLPQLSFRKTFEPQFLFDGLDRLIWGLVQKNVLANLLRPWVDRGFSTTATPATLDAWCLAIGFGLQIYFDFAGYTNIAIGVARLLGVTLPENFRQPYHAATPPDFWARWHMTLSRWIRDYLFFPLNARWRGAPVPLYLSLLGVMALVGLWHGAGWTYVIWGLLHGAYLVAYRIYEGWKNAKPGRGESVWFSGGWRIFTLAGVAAAWVAFRAPTLAKARAILSAMLWHFLSGAAYSHIFYILILAVAFFCAAEPVIARNLAVLEEQAQGQGLSPLRVVFRPVLYLFGVFLFLLFEENNSQFIYSQF